MFGFQILLLTLGILLLLCSAWRAINLRTAIAGTGQHCRPTAVVVRKDTADFGDLSGRCRFLLAAMLDAGAALFLVIAIAYSVLINTWEQSEGCFVVGIFFC